MKISVVTIVYNDVENIEKTILSVLSQTFRNQIEYIIVDGNSTDGTSTIIENHKDQIDKYIREKDNGIYDAMNKGIKNASGEYIIFINSGDGLAHKNVIEDLINNIGSKNFDLVYGNYQEVNNNNNDGYNKSKIIACRKINKIWYGPVASHQSTLYNLNFLRKNNLKYDLSYKIAADYKLTSEVVKKGTKFLKTDICISIFDIGGVSSKNQNLGLKEANRVRKEVLGWSDFRIFSLTLLLLGARFTKKYLKPIYSLIR